MIQYRALRRTVTHVRVIDGMESVRSGAVTFTIIP
jgi:hypothetical protein